MGNTQIRIDEIRATKVSTHPRLEIVFEPEFQEFGDNTELLEGHADVELSAGGHAGLTLPRMNIRTTNLRENPRIKLLDQLTGIIDLDHHGVGKIEEMRDEFGEDLLIEFEFSVLGQRRNEDSPTRSVESLAAEIPARDWEAVLDDLGYHDRRVIDLSIPETQIKSILENAHGQIERAQEHHDAHRYDDAVAAVRKAILKLKNIENNEEVMEALDGEKQDRVLNAIDEFGSSLAAFKSATDLGSHPEEQIPDMKEAPTRRDSELAVDVAKAYVRYVSRVIEESEESEYL